jgi:hypothetical protein
MGTNIPEHTGAGLQYAPDDAYEWQFDHEQIVECYLCGETDIESNMEKELFYWVCKSCIEECKNEEE